MIVKYGATTDELMEGHQIIIKIGEIDFMFIADNRIVAKIVPKWMSEKVVETCKKSFWDPNQNPPAVKTYIHGSIQTYGTLVTNLQPAGWQVEDVYIQVKDNGLKLWRSFHQGGSRKKLTSTLKILPKAYKHIPKRQAHPD